ncbi:MAG: hypothetical protein RML72_10780 [Bacteroidia bacterium]|nr:hypothetical protein [Bacteroidia bacterium]MDW8159341.1 hypothetical protein [Bacteroidia bacterium]
MGRVHAKIQEQQYLKQFTGVYRGENAIFSFWIESQKLRAHFFSASHEATQFFAYEVIFHSFLPNGKAIVSLLPFDYYKQIKGGKAWSNIPIFFKQEPQFLGYSLTIEFSPQQKIVCRPIRWNEYKFFSGEYQAYQGAGGIESLIVKMETGYSKPIVQYIAYSQQKNQNVAVQAAYIPFCSSPDVIQIMFQIQLPGSLQTETLSLVVGCCPGATLAEWHHNLGQKNFYKTYAFKELSFFRLTSAADTIYFQYFERGKSKENILLLPKPFQFVLLYKNDKQKKVFRLPIENFSFENSSFYITFPGHKKRSYCIFQEHVLIVFSSEGTIKKFWRQ